MIQIKNVDVYGWEHAIRGMRNPKNSWDKSDSSFCSVDSVGICLNPIESLLCEDCSVRDFTVGPNDYALMKKLSKAGTDHRKYMRMIVMYLDITAPLYWWKEFDTYKVGTVVNSCSTMHKIADKEFTLDDFSHENLIPVDENHVKGEGIALTTLQIIIVVLNIYRKLYLETKDKKYWWQMIQLLPSSYNQKRTVMLNYEVLANIYKSRKNHKLDEWVSFCNWIERLPHAELICGKDGINGDS